MTEEELRKKILKKRQRSLRTAAEGCGFASRLEFVRDLWFLFVINYTLGEMKYDDDSATKLAENQLAGDTRTGTVTLQNTTLKFGLESSVRWNYFRPCFLDNVDFII